MSAEPAGGPEDKASGPRIVICGAGIIGVSTAYYLAERGLGSKCTLVEPSGVATAASGRAAGFLARDWNDGSPLGPLARKSYDLHLQLAARFGEEKIGFRKINTWFGTPPGAGGEGQLQPRASRGPAWLQQGAWPGGVQQAGSPETTAQLHPRLLCQELVGAATSQGVHLLHGAVQGLRFEGDRCVAVAVAGAGEIKADIVVLAMGPWTDAARKWLPPGSLPPVTGLRRTSVLFQAKLPAEGCLFHLDGEYSFYPRPDGTLYMSGVTEEPEACPVPADAEHVVPNEEAAAAIERLGALLCPEVEDAKVICRQSCYMPVAGVGLPLIGALPKCSGSVLVGTGHGPWGILNGPATGLALAELASGGKRSFDEDVLAAFDPALYSPRA